MKNSLVILALGLAAAFPAALIMELAGTRLPVILDSAHLFGAFMLTFLAKIVLTDYARAHEPRLIFAAPVAQSSAPVGVQSPLRLAA